MFYFFSEVAVNALRSQVRIVLLVAVLLLQYGLLNFVSCLVADRQDTQRSILSLNHLVPSYLDWDGK
jgi:hypothetical protein